MPEASSAVGNGADMIAHANTPALTPPPGVTPNFTNPERQGFRFVASGAVLLGIMVLFLCSRLYTKCFIRRKATWDDLTCSLAALGAVAYYVSSFYGATRGPMGVHQWDVMLASFDSKDFLIPTYLNTVLISPTLLCAKLTFFLLYLQLFWPYTWLRIHIYVGAGITTAFYLGTGIAQFFFVAPVYSLSESPNSWYSHALAVSIATAAVGLAIDLYILILPIGGVWQLRLTTRRKVGVILIFMTGALASLASLLSLYYRVRYQMTKDKSWVFIPAFIASLAEMCIGVICACMPAFAHIFRHHLPPYEALQSRVHSRFRSLRSLFTRQSDHSLDPSTNADPCTHKHTSRYDGNVPYLNLQLPPSLRDEASRMHYGLGHLQSVRTSSEAESLRKVDDDGIHLKYELQHNSERYDEINEVPGRR